MPIVLFLAAIVSGALTLWLMWSHGLLIALAATAVVASAAVAVLAVVVAALGSRAASNDGVRPRVILDLLGLRQPR